MAAQQQQIMLVLQQMRDELEGLRGLRSNDDADWTIGASPKT